MYVRSKYAHVFVHAAQDTASTTLKKKMLKIPWHGPNQLSNMHLIDLKGIPPHEVLAMRIVEVYFDSFSEHKEFFLDPSIQLSQSQGGTLFAHIAKSEFASRPDGLKPTSLRPPTLDDIKDGQWEEEEVPSAASSLLPAKVPGLALGTMVKPGVKTKKPATNKRLGGGVGPILALEGGSAPEAIEDQAVSESRNSEGSKQSKDKDPLDEEMRQVADVHLQSGSGSSVKSLALLVPARFLMPDEGSTKYGTSSTLQGVGCS